MPFYSTNNFEHRATLKDAVLRGLAPDNGLYMPTTISRLPEYVFKHGAAISFHALSFEAAKILTGGELPDHDLKQIIEESITFDAPLAQLDENLHVMELFHGPTLAFKDFGARFLAALIRFFMRDSDRELCVLVATSGDTGSAVASAFLNRPNIRVFLLYPSGKVSHIQEMQLTTMGGNVTALEVKGNFDDCQRMVKQAFLDKELNERKLMTSANSINIARLIPQSFYYLKLAAELSNRGLPLVVSVPSGNFGNLTAGVLAKKMGAAIDHFVAATNANDVVPCYLRTGRYQPRQSVETISNAMDVGNPSNFARLTDIFAQSREKFAQEITASAFSDTATRDAMRTVSDTYDYTIDPHGAVAYLGLDQYLKMQPAKVSGVCLATAHPAKFKETVEECLAKPLALPVVLQEHLSRTKQSIVLEPNWSDLKEFILSAM